MEDERTTHGDVYSDVTGVHLLPRDGSRYEDHFSASFVEGVCCLLFRHLLDITVGGLHAQHVAAGIGVVVTVSGKCILGLMLDG